MIWETVKEQFIDFIINNNLTWIDNLTSSSGKQPNLKDPYVKEYINLYGYRKCEANAILPNPKPALEHLEQIIIEYLGPNCFDEYNQKIKLTKRETRKISIKKILN